MSSSTALRRFDPAPLLRSAPIALPQVLALVAIVTLSAAEGGFPLEHWAPAGVLVALLLVVSLFALPATTRPSGSRIAIALIGAFAIWSAMSLLWADDRGAAAIAATRTVLLASTFILFARWRHTPKSAHTVLTVLAAGLGILAWAAVWQLATADDLDPWFLYDRLLEPVGYVNAGAAFWGITAFLGIGLLSGSTAAGPRIIGAAVAVPGAALSLLCLSRGGVLASGIVVVLLLLCLPGRARNATALLIVGLGLLVGLPQLIDVGDAVRESANATAVLHTALQRIVVGAFLAVGMTIVWVLVERSVAPGDPARDNAAKGGAAVLAVIGVLALGVSLAGVGPFSVDNVRDSARTITKPYDPSETEGRLSAGLNSGRWDFWTVAWDQFEAAPVIGVGADNYRQDYLLLGKGGENPRYPHSMWARSLGQLGIVGTALLLGWVVAVLVAIRRLAVIKDPAARSVALAAGGAFGLWVVHGSVDWLMEYGGLSAIAAAVAGLAVAAGPQARAKDAARASSRIAERGVLVVVASLLLLGTFWTATQWVADRDRVAAAAMASDRPQQAVDRAERADALEPFGDQADMVLGGLAIRRGDYPAAQEAYRRAFDRNRRAARPRMWLGVLASAQGDAREARRWLRRAARVAPRDQLIAGLLEQVSQGEQLNPRAVQDQLAARTRGLTQDPDPGDTAPVPTAPQTPEIYGPPFSG